MIEDKSYRRHVHNTLSCMGSLYRKGDIIDIFYIQGDQLEVHALMKSYSYLAMLSGMTVAAFKDIAIYN